MNVTPDDDHELNERTRESLKWKKSEQRTGRQVENWDKYTAIFCK